MPEKFRCPLCGMESTHPEDIAEGYCGECHDFTGEQAGPDRFIFGGANDRALTKLQPEDPQGQ